MPTPNSNSQSLVVSVGAQCHVGKQRTENQDRVTRAATPFGDVFVVADGVGGYQGGAEAAQATVDGFVSYLNSHHNLPLPETLQQAVRTISADLKQRSGANSAMHGMGSTVVLCVINGALATYAHAGDSRAYLLRDRQLKQLTRDHSVMERLVSQGVLTPAQAREHPDASVLTRAIGQSADVSLDIAEIALRPSDALLLCSDGLWAYAPHKEIEAIAATETLSASAVSAALLNLALEGGGGDNISIQFLRFQALEGAKKRAGSLWGMSPKVALAGIALASFLAIGTAGLFVENQLHPKDNPNPEPSTQPAVSPPMPIPAPATPVKETPPKPASSASKTPTPASPAAPSKAAEKPANLPPATPPAAPGENKPEENKNNKEEEEKTPIEIIQPTSDSTSDWTGKLSKLTYVELSSRTGSDACLALERPTATLLYTSEKAVVAKRIQKELSLHASAVIEMSQEDLGKCGDEPMIALPAKPSIAERVKTNVAAGAEAAKTGLKTGVDTVKKKTKEKVEGQDTPSN
jgi:serine/threonine protein phosphatase PrpC